MRYTRFGLMLLGWLVWITGAALAQVGSCAPAEADGFLDVGNVRARIFNDGALFWNGSPNVYEVPKGSGINALFSANVWVGGMVDGELRLAGSTYGPFEFWPGPLDEQRHPPADCQPYDHLYEMTRSDVERYNRFGELSDNLRDWPWALGAPVVDGDGDPNNYNLAGGDRPALVGHQMLWWVMNDRGNEHARSKGLPTDVEVRGTAFAYDVEGVIGTTTFYRYQLVYKGQQPLEDAYLGLWVDGDLGVAFDDYIASDTTLHLGYFYNADNDDDEEYGGYGLNPPAIGSTFLQGPLVDGDGVDNDRDDEVDEVGERAGMWSFMCVRKGVGPRNAEEQYNVLSGLWQDGNPLRRGGYGGSSNETAPATRYCYSGDPTTGAFWTMENTDGQGGAVSPHDVRYLMSTGPFRMAPGETQEIVLAVVWARGEDHLDSVRKLKEGVAHLHHVAEAILGPTVHYGVGGYVPPDGPYPLEFAQNFPNPFRETTTIRYTVPLPMHVRLSVYDLLGREVALLVDASQEGGTYGIPFEAGTLPPGVYFYRIEMNHHAFAKKMMLLR